ncbi:HERC1, partial [Symbiodinium sp. KB8]
GGGGGGEGGKGETKEEGAHSQKDTESTVLWSVGSRLRDVGHLLLLPSKLDFLYEAVEATNGEESARPSDSKFHRGKVLLSRTRGRNSYANSECLFVQLFNYLNSKKPEALRVPLNNRDVMFRVTFQTFDERGRDVDEPGLDWGGLYRELLNSAVEDLFDPESLNLFIPVPNSRTHVGQAGNFVPNPAATAPRAIQMFEFVGKLMGLAIRQKTFLPFSLPRSLWKRLAGQATSLDDLEDVDALFVHNLKKLKESPTEEQLKFYTFSVERTDGKRHPLRPGGLHMKVTRDIVDQYIEEAVHFRLHEFDRALEAMYSGLTSLIPARALQLFTAAELEELVCGEREIDVELMKRHTTYVKYKDTNAVVVNFWKVLEEFTNEERVLFLRFVWGRTRLPAAGRWNEKPFKLTKLVKMGTDDTTLPIAHTCFMQLELPPYSTKEIMKKRLLTAMHFSVGFMGVA